MLRLLVPNRLRQHQSAAAEVMMRSRKPSPFLDAFIPVRDVRTGGFTIARGKRARTYRTRQYVLLPLADNNGDNNGNKKSSNRNGYVISRGKKRDTMSE